jgi:hypothetical protein
VTVSLILRVNGNYRATARAFIDGVEQGEPVIVIHGEEKHLPHTHGKTNNYEVTEEYIGGELA